MSTRIEQVSKTERSRGNTLDRKGKKDSSGEIRSRKWTFTLHLEFEQISSLSTSIIEKMVQNSFGYLFSHEIGSEDGKHHLQGYCEHVNEKSFKQIKELIGDSAHIEKAGTKLPKGTTDLKGFMTQWRYISKEHLEIWTNLEEKIEKVKSEEDYVLEECERVREEALRGDAMGCAQGGSSCPWVQIDELILREDEGAYWSGIKIRIKCTSHSLQWLILKMKVLYCESFSEVYSLVKRDQKRHLKANRLKGIPWKCPILVIKTIENWNMNVEQGILIGKGDPIIIKPPKIILI